MIRLLCMFGIHWEGIVVSGNLGCCTLCGEDTYAVFIVHKRERNAHGRILPRNSARHRYARRRLSLS
jgi:hypothetical protein